MMLGGIEEGRRDDWEEEREEKGRGGAKSYVAPFNFAT
jgi:hypothetical protein